MTHPIHTAPDRHIDRRVARHLLYGVPSFEVAAAAVTCLAQVELHAFVDVGTQGWPATVCVEYVPGDRTESPRALARHILNAIEPHGDVIEPYFQRENSVVVASCRAALT